MLKKPITKIFYCLINDRASLFSILALIVILIYGYLLRFMALDSVIINEFVTRDFDRAFSLLNGDFIPLAGPELTNGGRLPGPFLYFFLLLPLWLKPTYEILFDFNFLLNFSSLLAVFIISKKYFGFYFSAIATALIAVDLAHIGAVHFPTNPTYLIFFLILFVGVFFQFSIKRNEKCVPWLVLILSLGVQLHYQIATYILIPVLLTLIFKIKISKKSIFLSLMILSICFLPYGIYKIKTFMPQLKGFAVFSPNLNDSFFIKVTKAIPVQLTIERLFLMEPFEMIWYAPKEIKILGRIGFSLAFYFLILFIGIQSHRYGKEKYNKEISLIILFYTPALIFELINPIHLHYWYNYIFILPKTYIVTYVIILTFNSVRHRILKIGILFSLIIFFVWLSLHAFQVTTKALKYFNRDLQNVNNINSNKAGSYKNSKLLLNTFMNILHLNPKEYYDRVYFLDFEASSFNRIKLARNGLIEKYEKTGKTPLDGCFFILDRKTLSKFNNKNRSYDVIVSSKPRVFHAFLADSSIDIQDVREILFTKYGFLKSFFVYRYLPKFKHSCYNNSHNPFVVSKDIRSLLQEAKALNISTENSKSNFTEISLEEKYNSKLELLFWEGKYIILNSINDTPFRLTVTIRKVNHLYSVRGTVDSFFYFSSGNNNFRFLNILITLLKGGKIPSQLKNPTIEKFKAVILAKNTLLTTNGLNGSIPNSLRNYNQKWYRESLWDPKVVLTKNNFNVEVIWAMFRNEMIRNHRLILKDLS